jgi:hypothetical protein
MAFIYYSSCNAIVANQLLGLALHAIGVRLRQHALPASNI